MVDFAQVTVTPEELAINPGEQVQAAIFIHNSSNVVDVFTLEVDGLDEAWTDFSVNSVSLFPGDNGNSTLTISVPRASNASAGTYEFGVKVSSRKDPSVNIVIQCKLEVSPFYGFEATLNPQQQLGVSGRYTATLTNSGNEDLTIRLEGNDSHNACSFTYSQRVPTVPAGESVDVNITVIAKQRPLRGMPDIHSMTITAAPPQNTVPTVSMFATLQVPPRLPRWAFPVAIAAVVGLVGIIALAIFLTTRGGDEPQPSAPIIITENQPVQGKFDFEPGEDRSFDILVQEPGFLLVQVQWEVTGNGLEILIQASDTDEAFLEQLSLQGLDIVLLNKDLTVPTGNYEVPIQAAFANRALHVRLRNGTLNETEGNFSIQFRKQLADSPAPTVQPTVIVEPPTATATAVPTLTATSVPSPSPTLTVSPTRSPRVPTATPTPKPRRILKTVPINPNVGRLEIVPPADFDGRYEDGTVVRITAIPAPNCSFQGWVGSINDSSSVIKFEINEDMSLEAKFTCRLIFRTPTPTPIIFVPVTPTIRLSPIVPFPTIKLLP